MTVIAKIDGEQITADDLVKILKFNNLFDGLMEELVIDKLTVHAAKKEGVAISAKEVQARVDQFRRVNGLYRAKDTLEFLEDLGMTVDEFEAYISDMLYREKMIRLVTTEEMIEDYFRLHSPKFDSIEISHITIDTEDKAKEIMSLLEEDPDEFSALARQHSLDPDTRESGGSMGKVVKGALNTEIEAKVFAAVENDILGPFVSDDHMTYEIFRIDTKNPAKLDEDTRRQVKKLIFDNWLMTRIDEHSVEVL